VYFFIGDPFLSFAFWSGVASFVLTTLITIQIVYLRLSRLRAEQQERVFLAQWQPLLEQAIINPAMELPSLQSKDAVFFLKLWNHLHEKLSIDATLALNQIGARMGCYALAHQMLRGGGRSKHLLAILTLGQLRDRAAWHDLMAEAVFVDSAASLNALRALAQIDADAVIREMTPQLLTRDDWPAGRIIAIFQESPPRFHAPLLAAASEGPSKQQLKALRMVEGMHLSLPLPVLAHLLDEKMAPELIVAALRVTLYPQLLVVVRTHLTHTDWRVRVQAVKALGRIGRASDVSLLSTLLDDSEWWVRYRTAQALADIPSFNRSMLDHLLSLTDDRYAHDILNQVMAERGMA
jgi:HEAT repeats